MTNGCGAGRAPELEGLPRGRPVPPSTQRTPDFYRDRAALGEKPPAGWQGPELRGCGLGIRPHDDGVSDRDDLVDRQISDLGVLADRLRTARLVDADRADGPVLLAEGVASDPADVLGH